MEKLIAEEVVESILANDKESFMAAFNAALAAKVNDALEVKKVEVASSWITPEVTVEEETVVQEMKEKDDEEENDDEEDEDEDKEDMKEEVEQIDEATHFQYSGTVNDKDYELTIPRHKDLGDYSDESLHKKLRKENPHLAHHEVTAIVHSGGEEESKVDVEHEGKKYTHHVINHQEPQRIYNEEVEQVDEKYMGFKKLKAAIAKKGDVRDPAAVAAAIGRKKYGKEKFQAMAAAGKKAK